MYVSTIRLIIRRKDTIKNYSLTEFSLFCFFLHSAFTGNLFLFDDKNEMERMFFLVNGVLYVPGYLYLRRYYDELLPLW